MRTVAISLKEFWDKLEQRLTAISADELRTIVRALAQDVAPTERQAFLAKLKPMADAGIEKSLLQKKLLADIDDVKREITRKQKGADEWADDYGWGEGYYDDEDSLGPYEEFVEPLTASYDRIQGVFDRGNLKLARTAFERLFETLTLEDDYGRGVRLEDLESVDAREAMARYLRAVYETESPADRPKILFAQMQQARTWLYQKQPMLNDLIEISPRALPDREQFLDAWIAFLRKQKGEDADTWLREAVGLARGAAGLEELARAEGKKRPRAYLDWFAALEKARKHREVLAAAQEALKTLPAKLTIRANVADHLCAAAEKLDETEAWRAGRWEAFAAQPNLTRLLDLRDSVPEGDARIKLMRRAAPRIKDYLAHPPRFEPAPALESDDDYEYAEGPAWVEQSVLAHAYLLSTEWDAAQEMAAREKPLGWSGADNPQGLVLSFLLVRLSEKELRALPSNLKQLWQAALQYSAGFDWDPETKQEKNIHRRLENAYAEILTDVSMSHDQQEKFLAWCLDTANKRVDAIVGEQHRGSYDKAARLIGACAEVLHLRGDTQRAKSIVEHVRERFHRHHAFQRELDAAVGQAPKHAR